MYVRLPTHVYNTIACILYCHDDTQKIFLSAHFTEHHIWWKRLPSMCARLERVKKGRILCYICLVLACIRATKHHVTGTLPYIFPAQRIRASSVHAVQRKRIIMYICSSNCVPVHCSAPMLLFIAQTELNYNSHVFRRYRQRHHQNRLRLSHTYKYSFSYIQMNNTSTENMCICHGRTSHVLVRKIVCITRFEPLNCRNG